MSIDATQRIQRTRKPHECCWCGEVIDAGSAVWRDTIADEGTIGTCHWHDECFGAASRMSRSDREDCYAGWDAGDFRRGMTPAETEDAVKAERATNDTE